jgi:hypothetical protein
VIPEYTWVTSESEELEVDPTLEPVAEAVMVECAPEAEDEDATDEFETVAEWTLVLEDAASSLRTAARVLDCVFEDECAEDESVFEKTKESPAAVLPGTTLDVACVSSLVLEGGPAAEEATAFWLWLEGVFGDTSAELVSEPQVSQCRTR